MVRPRRRSHPKAVASHRTPKLALALLITFADGCAGDDKPARTPTPTVVPSVTATALPTVTRTPEPPTSTPTPAALCVDRTGGALISFHICENETLRVWSTADEFIDQAKALLATGEQRIPVFATLLDGTDCDRQWTWHPDAANQSFTELAIELCDGCPSHIEADKTYWFETVRQYCPWSARVVAVDDRRN